MNFFRFSSTMLCMLLSSLIVSADNDDNDDLNPIDNENEIELISNPGKPSGRPKAPSRQRISCHYTNGMLYIQFAVPEGNCELIVTNTETGDSQVYYFDSSFDAFINIGRLSSFELYITTEKGNSYFGQK